MEEWAKQITYYLANAAEILAAVIIGLALLRFMYQYGQKFFDKEEHISNQQLRIKFGSSLALSLELLLGADILATAVAPTWDEIGKLAAIATLRTALNYFLEKELKNSEERQRTALPVTVTHTTSHQDSNS